MSQTNEKQHLLNDLNERVLTIRDQLSAEANSALMASLTMAFFDLGSICEELKISCFSEICENLQQIFGQVSIGKRPFDDLIKESILMTLSLIYRSVINNEPCKPEIADLDLLIQGVKFGDREGFQVTDSHMPVSNEDQVTLFDDNDGANMVTEDPAPKPLNMLIVDDEIMNQKLMRHILAKYGIHDFASNGVEAVQLFMLAHENKTPYDVVFMDVMMPELDGHLATEQIRAFERKMGITGKESAIFMVTCLDSHDNICKAFFHDYCTDYITKPVNMQKILDKMREYGLLQ